MKMQLVGEAHTAILYYIVMPFRLVNVVAIYQIVVTISLRTCVEEIWRPMWMT